VAADDDFYEDDEPLEKIQAIRRREPDFVTGGRRAIADATQYLAPSALLEPPVSGPKGTVLRYGLADGTPGTGDMSAPNHGAGRDDD
jgi:hypothetical protein